MAPLYTPPAGFYDLPYTWVFDASSLTNGNDYRNLFVYMQGGLGGFVLRRVSLAGVFEAGTNRYQFRDASGGYIQSDPVKIGSRNPRDGFFCAPELYYPETSNIRFDLFNIQQRAFRSGFVGFQGVRRVAGPAPARPAAFQPKSFIYVGSVTLPNAAPQGAPVTLYKTIEDYDFELYQIILSITYPFGNAVQNLALLTLYDGNRKPLSNAPVPDGLMNGAVKFQTTGKSAGYGALVPPVYYPQESQIQVDVFPWQTDASLYPATVTIHMIGRQLIPRAA